MTTSTKKTSPAQKLQAEAKALALSTGMRIGEAKGEVAKRTAAAVSYAGTDWTVVSYGGGVDSTAILLRFLEMGFDHFGIDPRRFVVVMAQTGNEFGDLRELVETHLFPRLAAAGVRVVQVARRNSTTKGDYLILEDTTEPDRLHISGDYQLRDEMLAAGTIPQSGGARLCSIKSKGWPLDAWMGEHIDGPFRHVIGFECEELTRVLKDVHAGDEENRRPWYPLLDWGWNRARCLDYIEEQTGARWVKSACYFCPFAGQGSEKANLAERWKRYPELGADALMMEYTAQALNETQTLFGGRKRDRNGDLGPWDQGSAIRFANVYDLAEVLRTYGERLRMAEWALYRVRRVWTSKSTASRHLEIVARGDRALAVSCLDLTARRLGVSVTEESPGHVITRAVVTRKPESGKGCEEMYVAAPATARPKGADGFDERFDAAEEES